MTKKVYFRRRFSKVQHKFGATNSSNLFLSQKWRNSFYKNIVYEEIQNLKKIECKEV